MKFWLSIILVCVFSIVNAQNIITVAGNGSLLDAGDGGQAILAGIKRPVCVVFDKSNNCYIGQGPTGCRVRKITPDGVITTIAGTGVSGYSGDSGPATLAQLKDAQGVTVDNLGNVYVADLQDNRVRKITLGGIITTIAGTGVGGYNGDGIPATAAQLYGPCDLCFDNAGNLLIADCFNRRVRRINTSGIISTIAGIGIVTYFYGGDGGPADTTAIRPPRGVCVDNIGNVYIADGVSRILKINTSGIITTYAGNDIGGSSGDDGPATVANISPWSIAIGKDNSLYISEWLSSHKVRAVNTSGIIKTLVGVGAAGYSGDNSSATAAMLNRPDGVAIDTCGNLFICDIENHRIREVLLYPGCPDTTGGTDTTLVSSIPLPQDGMALFPNPVNETLHISGVPANTTYIISDMAGKMLLQGTTQNGSIPTRALPPGMYLIAVTNNDERVVRKFLKE